MRGWPRLARVFVPKLFPDIDASALFSTKSCPEIEVRKISGRRQWTMVRAGDSDKVDTVSVSVMRVVPRKLTPAVLLSVRSSKRAWATPL